MCRALLACLPAVLVCSYGAAAQSEPPVKFGATVVLPSGLRGLIYRLKKDSERLPDFRKLKSVGTIYTAYLNVPTQDFREGFPGVTKRNEWFAIDYTGKFWIDQPGTYRFALTSDDGSKLYIDDDEVIDNDGVHAAARLQTKVTLDGGIHRIRVSYFQGPRFQVALVLEVAPPGERFRIFSTDEFRPPAHPESWPYPAPGEKK